MSEPNPEQVQIERRRKRAKEEIAKVVNKGRHPVYSTFEITSLSGRSYEVHIRSLTEHLNSCTCPDYLTNLLGTCKHIEGTLLHLHNAVGDEAWDRYATEAMPVTQIYLHRAERTTVRVSLPLPATGKLREVLLRYFDAAGILTGAPVPALTALLQEIADLHTRSRAHLSLSQEVHQYLSQLQDLHAIEQQKVWFMDQVSSGARSLDVISTQLYGYQEQGAMHLVFGRRTMLADDMGLGKTVQAIAAASLLQQLRDIQRVIVVCPASLKHQWAREIRRFTSLPVQVIQGNVKARRQLYRQPAFFNIINYELVRRDVSELQAMRPDLIILDEAQRIKNWRTKTADAVKQLRSPYAFVLTGTPLENRLDELYSVFQFLDPRILGPLWKFNEQYFQLEKKRSGAYKVLGYKNIDLLRDRISPYVMRRIRHEVLTDLPARTDNNFFVEMTREQWQAYDDYRQTLARLLATSRRRPLTPKESNIMLMALVKMRLICNALALHDHELSEKDRERTSPKLRELAKILEDELASNSNKAIIFSQWAKMLDLTEPVLARLNLGAVKLTGQVPTHKRGELMERFFEDPDCRIFLSTDAGGVGLNLQAASLVINLDLPWNPAVLEQRIARAHRHGQPQSVQVINLIAQNTIEERILDTLARKRDVFQGVFGDAAGPSEISFADTGQSLLKQLDEMLEPSSELKPILELEPSAEPDAQPQEVTPPPPKPTLRGFADLLVGRYPGRVLLVRTAPRWPGQPGNGEASVLVVVDKDPAGLRGGVEKMMAEYYAPADMTSPGLLLMENESYRAFEAMLAPAMAQTPPEADVFRAPAMPAPSGASGREFLEKRLRSARKGFDQGNNRLKLANVVLAGGFPEEVLRPVRQALGWAYSSHIALVKGHKPGETLPSSRLIQAELVESERLPADLAARLSQVRELTAPPEQGEEAPPPSLQTAEGFIQAVQECVELGERLAAEAGL
ncbi:MAG: DEAD/DEAH box helicase [Chloroflexi bacterium]|nr:DEAD/DEAH box helicase [Chloroflexota bacterium]